MTKKQKSFALIPIICTFLFCAIMGIVGLLPTKTVSAEYSSPIPSGYHLDEDYEVLEITDGDVVASGSTVTLQKAMGNASVVKFKFTLTNPCTWATYFSVFTTSNYYTNPANYGAFYVSLRRDSSDGGLGTIGTNVIANSAGVSGAPTTVTYPSWISLRTQGNSYNIEIGAIKVFNSAEQRVGSLIYFEVDGCRLYEYYQNTDLPFTGNNFNFSMNIASGGKVNFSQFDQVTDLTNKATVSFEEQSYDCTSAPATPKPVVTAVVEKDGSSYGQVVEPKYYDVAYTNNDKEGTATATVTFKGKYSGSATGTFTTTVEKSPFEDYTSVIPEGFHIDDDYTVAELTNHSYTSEGDGGTKTYALDGADAMRFSVWYGTAVSYQEGNMKFSIFANNYYSTDGNAGMAVFTVQKNSTANSGAGMSITIYQTNHNTTKATKSFAQPEWMDFTTKDRFKIEIGGLDVVDYKGDYMGKYFYMDVNEVRVIEYFYSNSDLKFTNDNCNVWMACKNASITTNALTTAIDLTEKTKVELYGATSGSEVSAKANVYAALTNAGETYVQIVEPKYYTVAFTDNDKAGKATATITFNGKYSGTATCEFDIVAINLTSNSSVVQTIYAKKGASVTLGAIQVSGKVFVGYDVEGALKSSVTVEATEEKTVQVVAIDFVTEAQASVKLEGTMGMRFISNILASDKALLENYGTVTYGTKITSPTKSGYLNVPANVWSSVGAGERDSFTAVLKGFTENDYATKFKATAYVTITTADETITVYASVDEDFSRSIAEVAALTLDGTGVLATDPEFDENIHVTEYNGKYYEYSERAVSYLATAASYYVAE